MSQRLKFYESRNQHNIKHQKQNISMGEQFQSDAISYCTLLITKSKSYPCLQDYETEHVNEHIFISNS